MLALAFVALIPRFVIGLCLLRCIWKPADVGSRLLQIMLAAPVGIGISSLDSFLWIGAGLDLRTYAIGEVVAAVVIVPFTLWKERRHIPGIARDLQKFLDRQQFSWLLLVGFGMALLLGGFWYDSILRPHGSWDAWWNWNVVARFVYRGGAHWTGTFLRTFDHPDYPLLLAMTNATTWELVQSATTRGPIALALVFAISTAGLLYSLLLKVRDTVQASLAAVVLIAQPIFIHVASSQYADLPEAFYFLASAGLISVYLATEVESIPAVAGLAAGLAAWTKNEGIPFVLVSSLVWASIARRRRRSAMGYFAAGLAYPLLVLVGFKVLLAPGNDLIGRLNQSLALLTDVRRYMYLFEQAAVHLWDLGGGRISIVASLVVYAAIMGKSGSRIMGIRHLVLIVVAQLAIYLAIYLITATDLAWQVSNSLDRLYVHLFPIMLLSLFLWARSPMERGP